MSGGHFSQKMVVVDEGPVPEGRIDQLREMEHLLRTMGLPTHADNVKTIVKMCEMANSSEGYDLPRTMRILDKYAAGDHSEERAVELLTDNVEA